MVRELLTAAIAGGMGGRRPFPGGGADAGAIAFYQANEHKPENIAAHTSRLFLGVKIECAQCHNHPFAKWTRKQFWEWEDGEGRRTRRTHGIASLGGATLDNEENYLMKKLYTAMGAVRIENQARI